MITTFYVQMLARPNQPAPPDKDGLIVLHVRDISVRYYRFLYNAVGQDYHWHTRGSMNNDTLAELLRDPRDEVHVLHVHGAPAGFVELDRRLPGEIEIVQFGLLPEFIGQGLGKWFLHWAIERAWSYQPRRLWLHTCTNDHPAALPNYLKAGFVLYRQEAKGD